MKHLCWGLLLLPFFLNCATHAPMSEMVMFSPKIVHSPLYGEEDTLFYSRFSMAAGVEARTLNSGAVKKYSDLKFGYRDEGTADYANLGALSLHTIFMSRDQSGFAFNFSIFPTVGFDATLRLTEQEYFTFAHTVSGGQQYILQRRLGYNDHSGSSAGIFYEHFWQGYNYNEPLDCSFCGFGPDEEFYLDMIGVRVNGFVHDGMKNRMFLKGNLKLGYIPELKTASLGIGCSVGMY